jgi:hypothetical protein
MLSLISTLALSFVSAQGLNSTSDNSTMSTNNTTEVLEISTECLALIEKNVELQSCGMGLSKSISFGKLPSVNGIGTNEELDNLCTFKCADAIKVLGQDLISPACDSYTASIQSSMPDLVDKDIPAILNYGLELACSKDDSEYCFPTIAAEVGLMGISPTDSAFNQTLLCSKCFMNEYGNITAQNIGSFSSALQASFETSVGQIQEFQKTCANSAVEKKVLSALMIIGFALL